MNQYRFPKEEEKEAMEKIDFVLPWVDGSDKEWLAEKSKYIPLTNEDARINRYRAWGLLKYWFRGAEQFSPWLNKIYFITCGHLPEWLNTDHPKLNIIKHEDYIPSEYLPTFSSHAIELNLHRLKDLSDKFVFFNDDTFLTDYVKEEDFFIKGLPTDVAEEVPLTFNPGGIDHIIGNDMMIINKNFNKRRVVRENFGKWFNIKAINSSAKNLYLSLCKDFSGFNVPHLPQSFLKSTLFEVWEREGEILNLSCSHKFRNNEDVNQWLFRYWQLVTGNFNVQRGKKGMFFSIGRDDDKIIPAIVNSRYKMICLSDDDPTDDFEAERAKLIDAFEKLLPKKSSFEK